MPRLNRMFTAIILAATFACGTNSEGPQSVSVSGTVRDYFATTPVGAATVASVEIPTQVVTSSANGSYSLADLPVDLVSTAIVTATSYRATRNISLTLGRADVTIDMFAVGNGDAARQYTGLGFAEDAGSGMVLVNLVDGSGAPRNGLALSNIELLDQNLVAIGVGPFAFGVAGDLVDNGTLSVTTEFGGRSRIGFVNVPPGTYTLSVTTNIINLRTVVVGAGGVTLVVR